MNTTLKNETADIYDKVICVTNRHLCKESLPKQIGGIKTFRCTNGWNNQMRCQRRLYNVWYDEPIILKKLEYKVNLVNAIMNI